MPTVPTSPRYVVLAAEVRDLVAAAAPHTLVPSERELGEAHGVSRMTARKALALLEQEGLVYRRPPRGTFVSEPRLTFEIGSFSADVRRAGKTPSAVVDSAELIPAAASVAAALGLTPRTPVHALRRLRSADGVPIAVESSYYPAALTPGLLDRPLTGSLWALLDTEYGVRPVHARATVESVVIDDTTCLRMGVRSASPGLLLTRTTRDADARPIEYARDLYRADLARFEVTALLAHAQVDWRAGRVVAHQLVVGGTP